MAKESMTSAMCLVNRHERCRGQVISLAYVGPCAGPTHEPAPVDDDELEAIADAEADRLLELEADGWRY